MTWHHCTHTRSIEWFCWKHRKNKNSIVFCWSSWLKSSRELKITKYWTKTYVWKQIWASSLFQNNKNPKCHSCNLLNLSSTWMCTTVVNCFPLIHWRHTFAIYDHANKKTIFMRTDSIKSTEDYFLLISVFCFFFSFFYPTQAFPVGSSNYWAWSLVEIF